VLFMHRWKHVSPKKLSARKRGSFVDRSAKSPSVFHCFYDGLVCSKPCDYDDEDSGKVVSLGACYTVRRDCKIRFCSRLKGERPDPSSVKDLVRKAMLEDSSNC
jgi:hypothetical protein